LDPSSFFRAKTTVELRQLKLFDMTSTLAPCDSA
jgi:hypothetical protein